MTARQRALILAFALLGLGVTAAATYTHYHLISDPGYTSFCDVSETVSCSSVYRSAYGTVMGIPVALVGLLWFLLVSLLAWFDRPAAVAAAAPRRKGAPAPAVVVSETPS